MTAALAGATLVSAACAAAWLVVGARLLRRQQLPRHRAAGRALALAFLAGGVYVAVGAIVGAVVLVGGDASAIVLTAAWASAGLGLVTVGGLVAYLAHLLTGSPRAVPLVSAIYAAQLVAIVALLLALEPVGAYTTGWTIRFAFAHADASANPILASAVLAPAAVASVAYLALLPRTQDATARWRIALVGGGFALWLAAALAGRLAHGDPPALGASRAASAIAGAAAVLAYSPPAFARARWGVRALASEVARTPRSDAERDAQLAAIAARMRDLV